MTYYAHTDGSPDKQGWQLLKDHLTAVAGQASDFAAIFYACELAFAAGLLHDLGKYSTEFQRRLQGENLKVDHSTAGAQEAAKRYGKALGRILAYLVAGHHTGLQDYGSLADEASLAARLAKEDIPGYQAYQKELCEWPDLGGYRLPLKPVAGQNGFSIAFFIRMLYSCLVDADFLDTERYCAPERNSRRGEYPSLQEMLEKLDQYLIAKVAVAPATLVNRERSRILQTCRAKAELPPGLFTLTVPTGGGKTLSSLSFALRHAVCHRLNRVVYVIPFTSIIEQNARVFREAVGKAGVLEHHSNFQYPDEDSEDWTSEAAKLRLSAENWDAPLIVTTNVQFYESIFANRPSKCRKLHNLARSVIILDEAQVLPTDYLRPCLAALSELVLHYGATVVICTATQPALEGLLPEGLKLVELAPDPFRLYETFKRVSVSSLGELADDRLASELMNFRQVLCVVNTRRHARELYARLQGTEGSYHLSARMCPAHRSAVLRQIRQALQDDKPCRVISTQLIEAGVDVDFPVVFRASAGIDSIAQAAGRCNREGKREQGLVYVFRPEKQGLPAGWFSRTASLGESILRQTADPLSMETVRSYFTLLYDLEAGDLDRKAIMALTEERSRELAFPFREIAEKFQIIESPTVPVIIPWDEACQKLLRSAEESRPLAGFARRFQPYVVQVYPQEFAEMLRTGIIQSIGGVFCYLNNPYYYDQELGLMPCKEVMPLEDVLII